MHAQLARAQAQHDRAQAQPQRAKRKRHIWNPEDGALLITAFQQDSSLRGRTSELAKKCEHNPRGASRSLRTFGPNPLGAGISLLYLRFKNKSSSPSGSSPADRAEVSEPLGDRNILTA